MSDDKINVMALMTVGGRLTNERSYAAPSKYYHDPANHVKFQGEKMSDELRLIMDNWIRWALGRDYLPASTRCPLGYLYKATDVWERSESARTPIDGIAAVRLEKIIVGLPERHRQAVVMHFLNRAANEGRVNIVKGRDDRAKLLGVQKSQYHEIVRQAMLMIQRELR